MMERHTAFDEAGRKSFGGWRYGVEEAESRPFFLDDGRIVLNAPGGRLLGIDPDSGRVEVLHDLGSPVDGLAFHRESRRLLVGCQDGSVALLEA